MFQFRAGGQARAAKPGWMPEEEPDDPASQAVWTYRGYQLRSQDFSTAMVHFFRAYVSRAASWRSRLASTDNVIGGCPEMSNAKYVCAIPW